MKKKVSEDVELAVVPESPSSNRSVSPAQSNIEKHDEHERNLKPRFALLIAVAGCFGTGLFIGSGASLAMAGPLTSLLGYAAILSVVFVVCEMLRVLSTWLNLRDGLPLMTKRYLGDAFGFTIGWHVWFIIIFSICGGITASAMVINFWTQKIHSAILVLIMIVVAIIVNCVGIDLFSQIEFWLTNIKVVMMFILCVIGIVVMAGGNPEHRVYGFTNWTKGGGPMKAFIVENSSIGRFLAFLATLIQATFTLGFGPELVSIVSGETKNPDKYIPKIYRLFFYIMCSMTLFGIFVIGVLVPSDDPRLPGASGGSNSADSSPFVLAFRDVKIKALPDIINATILIAAFSAAVSMMYSGGQWLMALADQGNAPKIFARRNKNGQPMYALCVMFLISCICFVNASSSSSRIFLHLLDMLAVGSLISWFNISFIYYRFVHASRVKNVNVSKELGFSPPFGTTYGIYGMCFTTFVICVSIVRLLFPGRWCTATFFTTYLSMIFYAAIFGGYVFYHRKEKKPILRPLADIDLSRQ